MELPKNWVVFAAKMQSLSLCITMFMQAVT